MNLTVPEIAVTPSQGRPHAGTERSLVLLPSSIGPDVIPADLEKATLPPVRSFASLRYIALNVYRRLFSIVFLANFIAFIVVIIKFRNLTALINASSANLLACGLARQPLVVNRFFVLFCSFPRSAPLRLRRVAAKIYQYGGVHSGCGVAALLWYLAFVGVLSHEILYTSKIPVSIVALAYPIAGLLLVIIIIAYPPFRAARHNLFELTHRFSGWLVTALVWALILVYASLQPHMGLFLVTLPAFWFLVASTMGLVQPWLWLRRVKVEPELISTHAIRLHFTHTTITFGHGLSLSKHPLRDWHGFACFPDPQGQSFSCLVSKAGDWTSSVIESPPRHLWKRGIGPAYGFAYVMRMFRRIIVVTTGSGIGPCLSFLGNENRPAMRVVWQARSPMATYKQPILDLVSQMDPNALILDTVQIGRIDMLPIVYNLYKQFEAEAVCIISNPRMTQDLVFALESRGVPAYGPIFDS